MKLNSFNLKRISNSDCEEVLNYCCKMYVPAGYESTDSEDDYYMFDNAKQKSESNIVSQPVELSLMELKKQKLLQHLKDNKVDSLREVLDGEPKGFDIDETVDGHWNLLYHACFLALPDIVEFLIDERGACINMTENYETPLMVACYSKAEKSDVFKVVKALVKPTTIIGSANLYGTTPLMFASRQGNLEVVNFLISHKDAYDAIDNEGNNALFHAIEGKHLEVAKRLVKTGIDLTVVNKFGLTAKDFVENEYLFKFRELFPSEPQRYEPPPRYLSYSCFEDLIPYLSTK